MRVIKTLGLAVVAALASMALIGASSASAEDTALCKEPEELACPNEHRYPVGTEILGQLLHQTANSHENLLTTGGATLRGPNLVLEVTCFESHSKGGTNTSLADPFRVALSVLTLNHCFHKLDVACTVEIVTLGERLLLKTAPNLGIGSVHGVLAVVTCSSVFKCAYAASALPFHALGTNGADNPKLRFQHAKLKVHTIVGEIACPNEGFFDATYEITKPVPAYITL